MYELTALLSLYSLQQSMFAPLSRLGSADPRKRGLFEKKGQLARRHEKRKVRARTCEHRDDAQDDLFDALDRAPALGSLFVHRGVISGCMQDGNADGSIRVDCSTRQVRRE